GRGWSAGGGGGLEGRVVWFVLNLVCTGSVDLFQGLRVEY
uniref:Uncharacterized protein n=1 Tax=Aegilops tauschii subsp. strangulata TaxID=200361 RepID=A0A453MSG8_AEGTS